MIPDIGLMIGLYIITRMLDTLFKKDSHVVPKIFTVITIIVALICIADLMSKGSSGMPAHL